MLDPFPLQPPPVLQAVGSKIASLSDLYSLPSHLHEVLLAFSFYHFLCAYVSPFASQTLFPQIFNKFNKRSKLNWNIHTVSFIQAILICWISIWTMLHDEERGAMDYRERIWGYTGASGLLAALGCGYFLWDLWISLEHVSDFGTGLLAHAASAFTVFSLGFRPFVNYYAPNFLLYELSTPFLNIHWFCDKLDMTGSDLQFYNGILLTGTFFASRLVWGTYQTYKVFNDIFKCLKYQSTAEGHAWLQAVSAPEVSEASSVLDSIELGEMMKFARGRDIPFWLAFVYLGSNMILTVLNFYWFGQMISTIRKRFPPPFGTQKPEEKKETIMGRGVNDHGVRSVEVEQSSVKKRTAKGKARHDHLPANI